MTDEEWYQLWKPRLVEHAKKRREKNYGPQMQRWGQHQEQAAVEGEAALARRLLGGEPDLRFFERGDGGVDNLGRFGIDGVDRWITLNAKAVWKRPVYLLVRSLQEEMVNGVMRPQVGHVRPDVYYVLSGRPPRQGEEGNDFLWPLHGFMRGDKVMTYPADYFMGNASHVHIVPAEELSPMSELEAVYRGWWCHRGEKWRRAEW